MIFGLKKLIPKPLLRLYHYTLAIAANFFYRSPSDKLIVIGVTGTSGKSTVAFLIAKMLEMAGFRVGLSSTVLFKVDKKEWLNDKKMTMIGRFALQRLISGMVKANCHYAVIETTSQGIEQFRHLGINYDTLVFTNLYPEHIEAHGSFANYQKAKLKLFAKLKNESIKLIANQKVKKSIIVNLDDKYQADFLNNWAEEKFGYTLSGKKQSGISVVGGTDPQLTPSGVEFKIDGQQFRVNRFGRHNIYNLLAAATVGLSEGLKLNKLAENLTSLPPMPGNFELIDAGQPFKVIVDYAFEPKAVAALYESVKLLSPNKVIHVLGSAGGGRDKARRPLLGELAAKNADYVIITNEDPYDEDPQMIINEVFAGAKNNGKKLGRQIFKILDRRTAIAKALSLAQSGDIVLITGKGAEQAMVVKNNKKIPWDDRRVVREELGKIAKQF